VKTWWIGLSRRERAAVLAGALLVLGVLVYVLAIEPAARTRTRLAAELPRLQAEAAEVRALALEAQRLKTRALALESPEQAKAALERLLAEKKIPDNAIREADGRLLLTVRRADAASWLAWLAEVSNSLPLRVSSARVSRTGPGVVDAEVALAFAGAK
jgi:general secretion pathway protein M